jgi:hypothetical protein
MAENPQQQSRPDSYSEVAWLGAWKQRAAGMWAAGGLGLAFGAAIGAVAPFFPVMVGAMALEAAVGMLGVSIATFAATGIVAGAAAGGLVGLGSGGAAAVARESERRDQSRLEALGVNMPEAAPLPEKQQGLLQKLASYINPRSLLIFTGLGVAAGLVFAAAPIMTGAMATSLGGTTIGMVVGAATNAPLATAAYCAGVMGCFGALFGVNFSALTNDVRKVTSSWLSTRFGDEKKVESAVQPQLAPARAHALEAPAIDVQAEMVSGSFVEKHAPARTGGFKEVLAAQGAESPSSCVVR